MLRVAGSLGTAARPGRARAGRGRPVALGLDCHRLILGAAADLLAQAQRRGTARADLTADGLVQLVVGIALSTARGHDAQQPDRLVTLVLDAAYGTPLQN
ncbi:SbtR family transcriptional regulator [Streptomyces sp. NBC_01411]